MATKKRRKKTFTQTKYKKAQKKNFVKKVCKTNEMAITRTSTKKFK